MKKKLSLLLLSSILFFSNAQSSPLSAGGGGSIQSILNMQIGNVVTIKLQSGNELIGIVDSVNAQVVHLSKIAGKEYFDAAASINSIEALLVKTKNNL